jgi:hypothetical protein
MRHRKRSITCTFFSAFPCGKSVVFLPTRLAERSKPDQNIEIPQLLRAPYWAPMLYAAALSLVINFTGSAIKICIVVETVARKNIYQLSIH